MITELTIISVTIFLFVTVLFILSLVLKRNDIADVAWGVGILLVAGISYGLSGEDSKISTIIFILIGLWGLRLSARIFLRNRKKEEDYRYKKWRDSWGSWFYIRSYLQVYILQGFLMIVVGYSTIHASMFAGNATVGGVALVGIIVWCIGYFFEVVGDYQLDAFIKSKPASGTILSTGLWRYTRHPNYFGEVTMWWGIWFMVATLPMGYIALISPLTITFLILKVSGIPLLEEKFKGNPQFELYKEKTSAFIPLPPKRNL